MTSSMDVGSVAGVESEVAARPFDRPEAVSVVVVNWNTALLLDRCLDSVERAVPNAEIVVVDNGSTDRSLELLARRPNVRVIVNASNVGYQAACNQGTRATSGSHVVHINADAELEPGTLERLLDVLAARPDIGVVGPRLVYGDGSFQRWTAGRRPSWRSLVVSFLLADRFGLSGRGVWIGTDDPRPHAVDWVSSACLVVRREVFDAVDGLDERFFAYMDDVDLGVAANARGWTVWYEPTVTAVHLMGGSQQHPGSAASPSAIRALVTWCRFEYGSASANVAVGIITTGFLLRAVAHSCAAVLGRSSFANSRRHLYHARIALSARTQT
jgi:N-acetylglucosaminyl-diphospho-decaprenol L-rhamnosyltransferase